MRTVRGSISYAEFRHLGKQGVLGRYPIHFHLCGDSMRGSSVIGASIWDSANRFLTIHGTDYLVVRDCVGFRSMGHGFFLENGTETRNILDHNLACVAMRAKPLPEQELSFDGNDGAGFWWANSLNTFTRNVSVENDQYGYRFEVIASKSFDPVRKVLQPDGSRKDVDMRTLPFIPFEDNEVHCQRRFGINLGGFNGLSELNMPGDDELADVGGVGPDIHHPFVLRNTKIWDCDWAYHSGSPRRADLPYQGSSGALWGLAHQRFPPGTPGHGNHRRPRRQLLLSSRRQSAPTRRKKPGTRSEG